MAAVPKIRIQTCNGAPVASAGEYVLYWMIAARRTRWNFALDRAIEWAVELRKPLLIFEPLRCGYRWASDRLHRFAIDGMAANAARLAVVDAAYYPYVEPQAGAGQGLLEELARRACVVVTDDFPCFFLPRMVAAAAAKMPVRIEQIDSNGLLPLRAAETVFPTAYAFRRFLQRSLPEHLGHGPSPDPFAGARLASPRPLPADLARRWPPAARELLAGDAGRLAALPIDHAVPVAPRRGGALVAEAALAAFLHSRLPRYCELRNEPDAEGTSVLSPYLHFGHLSVHQAFADLAVHQEWTPAALAATARGRRAGWWGMSEPAEAFLDQLVTWRELGFNQCRQRADYDQYESLPAWARATLAKHAADRRSALYTPDDFEQARTHDRLWNAAQLQLLTEGRIHNYLRMLWGKKILEWSPSPQEALAVMIEVNNKYALDGRDPNSYSGIFWTLGRYDRPWGPERPVFGKVRYMSSTNTARKLRVDGYLERYGPATEHAGQLGDDG